MMERIKRRKILLIGESWTATEGAAMPIAIPAAMPMKIQVVSESRLTVLPIASPLSPFKLFAQHVEEQHAGRADQHQSGLRAPAHDLVALPERLADLAINREERRVVVRL